MNEYAVIETFEGWTVQRDIDASFQERLICRCPTKIYAEHIVQALEECPVATPWDCPR